MRGARNASARAAAFGGGGPRIGMVSRMAQEPQPEAAPRIGARALRGSLWTVGGLCASQLLRLASNIAITRLLAPEVYGLMGLVNVFMTGLVMFSDIGLGPSIIQSKRGEERDFLDTAWTLSVVRGLVLALAACALAWPVAWVYADAGADDPKWQLALVLPVAGLSGLIGGLCSTSVFSANRKLALGRLMLLELAAQVFGLVVMLAWAWWRPTVWAMVGGNLASALAKTALSFVVLPQARNRFRWEPSAVREMWDFGKWIFLSTAVTFFAFKADQLMLFKLVTLEQGGVYVVAIVFAGMALEVVSRLTTIVIFPVLSEQGRDAPERMEQRLAQVRGALLQLGAFALLAMLLLLPAAIRLLYRPEYHGAGWMAQLSCFAVWFAILKESSRYALVALGSTRPQTTSNAVDLAVKMFACVLGHHWFGMPGFILGFASGGLAGHLVIVRALAEARIRIARTDLNASAALAAAALLGLAPLWLLPERAGPALADALPGGALLGARGALELTCALPVLALHGWLTWRRVSPLLRGKPSGAAGALGASAAGS